MQDIEFTVENSRLFILQTRNGKRTARAAIQIAVTWWKKGLLPSVMRLNVWTQTSSILFASFIDPKAERTVLAKGLPVSPGAAAGRICFGADEAVHPGSGRKVVLVRQETSPEDIHGMHAEGILTSTGGMTSHAAVVARGMGKPCIAGM